MTDDLDLDADLDADDTADGDASASRLPASLAGRRPGRTRGRTVGNWSRWLHVYTSMISLLVVLFFGLTGITLNHPSWTFGDDPTTTTSTGTLPADTVAADGTPDFLAISEYLRSEYGVSGSVADYGVSGTAGNISWTAAGYAAGVQFDTSTRDFQLTVEAQGFVGVMNDLHKGRDTTDSWRWAIDVSGGFLVVVAITGLGIQVFQKKRRRKALLVAGVFTVVSIVWLVIGRG
jgi:hypothetical protein